MKTLFFFISYILYSTNAYAFDNIDSLIEKIELEKIIDNIETTKKPSLVQPKKTNIEYLRLGKFASNFSDKKTRKPIIVIDSGHGGKDPGAIGYKKIKEKHITLKYAKYLKSKLDKTGKYQVFLTRQKDIYIPLRNRNSIAVKKNADLFISIHADSALNKKARGLSVYTLSNKASSKEAALLATKENKADIISGLKFGDLEKETHSMLIDLSLRDAKKESKSFARIIAKNTVNKNIRTRSTIVHSAGFVVLKNPNMTSILVELGFLSNKYDAKNLQSYSYKERITNILLKSIRQHFINKKLHI